MDLPDYDDYVRRGEVLKHVFRDEIYRRLYELAGPSTSELFQSIDAAAAFLDHDTANHRIAAIHSLVFYWDMSSESDIAKRIRSMVIRDTEPNVRRAALIGCGTLYAGTDDVEIGELLARLVLDESSDSETRTEAYDSLRRLQHKRLPLRLQVAFRFPDDVDWAYVHRFLDTSRRPEPKDPRQTFEDAYLRGECAGPASTPPAQATRRPTP